MINFFSYWKNFSTSQKDRMINPDFRPTLKAHEISELFSTRADCDAPCFEQLKATHLRASPKQQALLDVLFQLIKTWPLTIGPCPAWNHTTLHDQCFKYFFFYRDNHTCIFDQQCSPLLNTNPLQTLKLI